MTRLKKILLQLSSAYSTFHKPSGRENVLLVSSPRSGSTWLTELIHTQGGFQWCREPFNIRNKFIRDTLGIDSWSNIYDDNSNVIIDEYLMGIASGKLKRKEYKYPKLFSRFWRFKTDRTVFKILHGCEHRVNHLSELLNAKIIFLIRHPIPVTISREEYPRLNAFIDSDFSKLLTEDELKYSKSIIEHGSVYEKGMLDWCLQNVVLLRAKNDNWVFLTYEQLVLEPEKIINIICEQFNFAHPERMLKTIHKPSGSTGKSVKKTQEFFEDAQKRRENSEWLIKKWKAKISDSEEEKLMKVLNVFNIDIYKTGFFEPDNRYYLNKD